MKFIALIVLIIISSCQSHDSPNGKTGVTETNNPPEREKIATSKQTITIVSTIDPGFGFYYLDMFGGNPIFPPQGVAFTVESKTPIYLMQPDADQTGYYLSPGDSVIINKHPTGYIYFTSGDSLKDHAINFFSELTRQTGSIRHLSKHTYLKKQITLAERDEVINNKYKERKHFLETYKEKHTLNNTFITFAENVFDYARVYEKLYLYYPEYDRIKIRNYYSDSLKKYAADFNCDTCLDNPFFLDALVQVARNMGNQKDQTSIPAIYLSGLSNEELMNIYDIARNHFTDNTLSYILTAITRDLVTQRRIPENTADSLMANIKDPELKDYIEKRIQVSYKRALADNLSEQKLYTTDSSDIKWDKLLATHKNKVLYIDLWASWCKPCLAEMPASHALKASFKNKPIEFLYFSLDEEYKKWKKATATYSILENSYWVDGDFISPLAKKFNLISIPRYILIDKNGKVFTDNALRPTDKNLLPILNKLINQ